MNATPKTPWPSILLLILSLFSSLTLLSIGTLMGLAGMMELLSGQGTTAQSALMYAAGSIFMGVLLWPAVYYSLMKILNKTAVELPLKRISSLVLVIVWVISVSVSMLGEKNASISILLIPFSLLAFVLPVWLLTRLGLRGFETGSPERRWGTIAVGMTIVPLIIGFLEVMVILIIGVLTLIWISSNPSLLSQFENIGARLMYANNPEAVFRIISSYLFRPLVIFAGLAYLSVCIPLIEELIKPFGVWLGSDKLVTPDQGFAFGVLCGAAYALAESLGVSPGIAGSANLLSLARVGTDLLHIVTAGLMGWALVQSWRERKFIRLGVTYLTVVLLHGLWNALSLALAAGTTTTYMSNPSPLLSNLATVSAIGLVVLTLINLAILIRANQQLRPPAKPVTDSPESGLFQS